MIKKSDSGLLHLPSPTPLTDPFGRHITYLRLGVTDRCNLRCVYCMPPQGIPLRGHHEMLSYEEMLFLTRLLTGLGISKLRITGGEPFVRKGLMDFLHQALRIPGLKSVHITTNGVLTEPHLPALKEMGLAGINLSLDTLQRERFARIARRDLFDAVRHTLSKILQSGIPLKINSVIQKGFNEDEIVPLALIAREHPVHVRFIEQMPFHGGAAERVPVLTAPDIQKILQERFPDMRPDREERDTARLYRIPGFAGRVGLIGGFSRTFCDSCSRIRITPAGMLKTCLYDNGVLDLKQLIRNGATETELKNHIRDAIRKRFRDGFEAERQTAGHRKSSMAVIGG